MRKIKYRICSVAARGCILHISVFTREDPDNCLSSVLASSCHLEILICHDYGAYGQPTCVVTSAGSSERRSLYTASKLENQVMRPNSFS